MHWRSVDAAVLRYSVLAALVLLTAAQTSAVFTTYPANVTAALGTMVTVECAIDQPSVVWEVNNVQLLTEADALDLFAGIIVSLGETVPDGAIYRTNLTFAATEKANDTITHFICQAGPNNFALDDGEIRTFSVYGLPLAPGELQLIGDTAHQLRLSWSQPFTLPGETVSYSLLIQNLATGWNRTVGGLTETSYTHSLTSEAEALACHTFLFSVSSSNAVGLSLNSSSAQAIHPSAPGQFGELTSSVVLGGAGQADSQAQLLLSFQTPPTCFPLVYEVVLTDALSSDTSVEVNCSCNATTPEELAVPELGENALYNVSLSARNHFQFSVDNPVQATAFSVVTSGVQSVSVFQFENETLQITCTFAEGTISEGCKVTLTIGSLTAFIELQRAGGELVVVKFEDSVNGAVSAVRAEDLGVAQPLSISGDITSEATAAPPISSSPAMPTPDTTSSDGTLATPTATTDDGGQSSGLNLLTVAIPAGAVVAILVVLVFLACCFICCCRRRSSKYTTDRRDTLPYEIPMPHSPTSVTSSHDYKQIHPRLPGNIKEMSFNPLYGDHSAPPLSTFEPPLPCLPQRLPSNGSGPQSPHETITLPSNLPPVYEEISSAKAAAKLAANPQYGAVGGANGATLNPQYGSTQAQDKDEHMYASLKEPGALGALRVPPKLVVPASSPYALPYEHVRQLRPAEGVAITTDDNVSYNVSPASSTTSPQKSL